MLFIHGDIQEPFFMGIFLGLMMLFSISFVFSPWATSERVVKAAGYCDFLHVFLSITL